jgi:hypothetical protein
MTEITIIDVFYSKHLKEWVASVSGLSLYETGVAKQVAVKKLRRLAEGKGYTVSANVQVVDLPEYKQKAMDSAIAMGLKGTDKLKSNI